MVMCRACGTFVPSYLDDGTPVPLEDVCPECGGTEFKDNESGEHISTG